MDMRRARNAGPEFYPSWQGPSSQPTSTAFVPGGGGGQRSFGQSSVSSGGGVGVGGDMGLDNFMVLMSSFSEKVVEATEAVGKFALTVNHSVSVGGNVNVTGAGTEVQQALARELLGSVSSLVQAEVRNIVGRIQHHGGQGDHRLA